MGLTFSRGMAPREICRQSVPVVRTGSFGADMKVRLCNDGPFTIMLDSDEILG